MSEDPLTLLVEFQVREDEVSRDEWLSVWSRRAADAFEHEPETGAYGAAVSLDQPDAVLIFERYQRGELSLHNHMERLAHTELIDEMTERRMTKRRLSGAWLAEVEGCGWWGPADPSPPPHPGNDLRITGIRFDNPEATARFITRSRAETVEIRERFGAVQILGFGQALKPDDRNPQLDAGDLIVVSLGDWTDRDLTSPWPAPNEGRVALQRRYRTTEAGFFWR